MTMSTAPRRRFIPTARVRLLAAAALMLAAATAAAGALEPFSADYRASFMGMQANGTMTLERSGADTWEYKVEVAGMGARLTQRTLFEEHNGRWRPLSSEDTQAGESGLAAMLVKNETVKTTYDWDRSQARWSGDVDDDARGPVQLRPGDMDGMLINLAVVRDVAAGRPLEYRLVEDGRARAQRFQVDGTETITVDGQEHEATRVVRTSGRREITAWIVDGLPVPARILQRRNGRDHIDMRLQSVN